MAPTTDDDRVATADRSSADVLATAKGGGFLLGGSFFGFAARFVIALILTHALGVRDYGVYVLAISAASLFGGVALFGLDDAMVRYVAILSGRKDDAGVAGTLQFCVGLSLLFASIMGFVLYLLAEPLAIGVFDTPALAPVLKFLALVVPINTGVSLLVGAARGFGRMDLVAFSETVLPSVLRIVAFGALAAAGALGITTALVVYALSLTTAVGSFVVLINRRFPLRLAIGRGARRDVGAILRYSIPLWISGLLRQFRRNIQNVMLGAAGAVANVGVFAVVNQINLVANATSQSLYSSVRPILARLHDQGERERLANIYTTSTRWTLTMNLPFCIGMLLYPASLLAFFGRSFVAGSTALVILAFGQLANAATGICQSMLDMTGHVRIKLFNTVLNTILLIGGGLVLIPRWDVIGAAVTALIAMVAINILCVIEVWVLERMLPFDRSFLKPVGAGVVALLVGILMLRTMPVGAAIAPAILQGAIVTSIYAGVLLLLRLAPEDRLVLDRVGSSLRLDRLPLRRPA